MGVNLPSSGPRAGAAFPLQRVAHRVAGEKLGRSTSGCGSPRWRVFKISLASVRRVEKACVQLDKNFGPLSPWYALPSHPSPIVGYWAGQAPRLSGRISQPMVLPSGQTKIGCWPGCLSLQPVTLQSPALAEGDTPANSDRPIKAVTIVLIIILLRSCPHKKCNTGRRLPLDVGVFLHRALAGGAPLDLCHVRGGIPEAHAVSKRFATTTRFARRRLAGAVAPGRGTTR